MVKKRHSRSEISVFWLTRNAKFSWGRRKKGSRVSSVAEWELRWQVWVERFGLSKRTGLFGHKTRLWRVANSAFVEEMCRRRKEVILHILRLLVKQERILVIHVGHWAISLKRGLVHAKTEASTTYQWQMNLFIIKGLRKCHKKHLCVDWQLEKYLVQIKRRFDIFYWHLCALSPMP